MPINRDVLAEIKMNRKRWKVFCLFLPRPGHSKCLPRFDICSIACRQFPQRLPRFLDSPHQTTVKRVTFPWSNLLVLVLSSYLAKPSFNVESMPMPPPIGDNVSFWRESVSCLWSRETTKPSIFLFEIRKPPAKTWIFTSVHRCFKTSENVSWSGPRICPQCGSQPHFPLNGWILILKSIGHTVHFKWSEFERRIDCGRFQADD